MSLNRKYSFSTTYTVVVMAMFALVALTAVYTLTHQTHATPRIWRLVALTLVFATAQAPDKLVLNGKEFSIQTNPLRPFLEKNPHLRWERGMVSTANWRGYIATWRINGDRLTLTKMEVFDITTEPDVRVECRSVMSSVFPGQTEVFAHWFTGYVVLTDGECVHYVHQGYASTYEKYIIFRIEQGIVTQRLPLDHAGFLRFRNWQFDQFTRTEEYRKTMVELFEERQWSAEQAEGFMRAFYAEEYTSRIFEDQQYSLYLT